MDQQDKFYTPNRLADQLISLVAETDIHAVADFCVGNGDLLKALKRRFPKAQCFGVDVSEESIERLRREHTDWTLGTCDFMERACMARLDGIGTRRYDLIVFNPPFTCKGSTLCRIVFDGQAFKCSTALMFLAEALGYLNERGVLYAILPIGCMCSQKDKELWDYLAANYQLKVLEKIDRPYWRKCSPNILLVSLKSAIARAAKEQEVGFDFTHLPIKQIVRGTIGMHEMVFSEGMEGRRMIHTTNMQNNHVTNVKRVGNGKQHEITGVAVLIPRVCNPNKGKICIYNGKKPYVLSDCVVALRTENVADAQIVFEAIILHWDDFRGIYNGTGAKYTTMVRLKALFGV